MGLDTNTLSERSIRSLKKAIIDLAKAFISINEYQRTLLKEKKQVDLTNKVIRQTKKFIKIIENVKHEKILQSVYATFIGGKESLLYLMVATGIKKTTIVKWDTEEGYQEFLKLEEEAVNKHNAELEERKKQQEIVEKAKEEGKKVEYAYENGKMKPIIVDEKAN